MKGISKRITLVTLALAMALTLIASPSMAEEWEDTPYSFINERYETLGDFDYWPLEEKAAFSEWCVEQGIEPPFLWVYGMPGENNMTFEEALDLARQAIIAKYAIKEAVLRGKFKVEAEFIIQLENENGWVFGGALIDQDHPIWRLTFRVKDYNDIMDLGHYLVYIYDQTKEMEIYNAEDSQG